MGKLCYIFVEVVSEYLSKSKQVFSSCRNTQKQLLGYLNPGKPYWLCIIKPYRAKLTLMTTAKSVQPKSQQTIVIVLFILVIFALLTWGMYEMLTGPARYNNRDFMSLFAWGKAILRGLDPYDPAVWNPLWAELGSIWMPNDRTPFPLWTLLLVVVLPWGTFWLAENRASDTFTAPVPLIVGVFFYYVVVAKFPKLKNT